MADEVRVEYRKLADLARWPRNPKGHDIPQIKQALRRWGFVVPLTEDAKTEQLVAGHGRLEALLEMQRDGEAAPARVQVSEDGSWAVPVVSGVAFANEREAEGYLLADNRLVEAGGWNQAELEKLVKGFKQLEGTGWTEDAVAALAQEVSAEPARGNTPEDLFEGFVNAEVKQVVFYFGLREYDDTLGRMHKAMADLGVEDQSSLLLALLDRYEEKV